MNHDSVADRFSKGEPATGCNMYSDGECLYSYGEHFVLAVWLDDARKSVAICNDDYSRSTSQHQNITHNALRWVDKQIVSQETAQLIKRARLRTEGNVVLHVVPRYVSCNDPITEWEVR